MPPPQTACIRCHSGKRKCEPSATPDVCIRCVAVGAVCERQGAKVSIKTELQRTTSALAACEEEVANLRQQLSAAQSRSFDSNTFTSKPFISSATTPWNLTAATSISVAPDLLYSLPSSITQSPSLSPLDGLLSLREAESIVSFFFKRVTVWGAIFRLFAKSAAVLERESPALLVTLCAVAGRRTGTLSKDALEGLWERSAAILQLCSSSTNAHPLDIVALLVRSEYQPHPSYTDGFGRARTTTRLLWLTSASRLSASLRTKRVESSTHPPNVAEHLAIRASLTCTSTEGWSAVHETNPNTFDTSAAEAVFQEAMQSLPLTGPDVLLCAVIQLASISVPCTRVLADKDISLDSAKLHLLRFQETHDQWAAVYASMRNTSTLPLLTLLEYKKRLSVIHVNSYALPFFARHVSSDLLAFRPFVFRLVQEATTLVEWATKALALVPYNLTPHLFYDTSLIGCVYPSLLLVHLGKLRVFQDLFEDTLFSRIKALAARLSEFSKTPADEINTLSTYVTAEVQAYEEGVTLPLEDAAIFSSADLLARAKALTEAKSRQSASYLAQLGTAYNQQDIECLQPSMSNMLQTGDIFGGDMLQKGWLE